MQTERFSEINEHEASWGTSITNGDCNFVYLTQSIFIVWSIYIMYFDFALVMILIRHHICINSCPMILMQ